MYRALSASKPRDDRKPSEKARIETWRWSQASSYSDNRSNRLFVRGVLCIAALYSAAAEVLSNAKFKRWSCTPPLGFFFLAEFQSVEGTKDKKKSDIKEMI
jgi:hypothetical protein